MKFLKVHSQLAVNPAAITLSRHKDFTAAEDALAVLVRALNARERQGN